MRLRAESVWPVLTGARILPPSGGGRSWWGASLWCVKRLLVAVSMAVECRGWRQSLPCPLASRRLGRAGLGGRLARSRPSVRLSWWAGRPPPVPVSFLVCAGRPLAAGPRRLAGPYRGSSGPPCSRSWPGAHSLPASITDEDLDILVIPISPAASRCTGEGRPVGDRSGVHVRARPQPHSARPLRLSAAVAGCRG